MKSIADLIREIIAGVDTVSNQLQIALNVVRSKGPLSRVKNILDSIKGDITTRLLRESPKPTAALISGKARYDEALALLDKEMKKAPNITEIDYDVQPSHSTKPLPPAPIPHGKVTIPPRAELAEQSLEEVIAGALEYFKRDFGATRTALESPVPLITITASIRKLAALLKFSAQLNEHTLGTIITKLKTFVDNPENITPNSNQISFNGIKYLNSELASTGMSMIPFKTLHDILDLVQKSICLNPQLRSMCHTLSMAPDNIEWARNMNALKTNNHNARSIMKKSLDILEEALDQFPSASTSEGFTKEDLDWIRSPEYAEAKRKILETPEHA